MFGYVANQVMPKIHDEGLDGRFHVLGGLDLPDVRALAKSSDIFLLPSLWENCPYSCIEAMAARLPIVSSDCAGMPELIADRVNGLLARSGDAESFARAVEELVDTPALRERLALRPDEPSEERLTDVTVARRIVDVYSQSLKARRWWASSEPPLEPESTQGINVPRSATVPNRPRLCADKVQKSGVKVLTVTRTLLVGPDNWFDLLRLASAGRSRPHRG